ncbi:hydroxymethylglutaryl-CoA reductase (NADPH), partial [Candidatus Micrarchaeota archaeon]|nr:hydroxymethylglutaryl-CoA reductase (NADPH) [Candidatus Micrarchaeota archaeon]
ERHVGKREAVELRRAALEKLTGAKLDAVGKYSIDPDNVIGKSIENMIGAVQVPLGFAGPLAIRGDHANGEFYVPLATTEGALVASVNRGCRAITESGGCQVKILDSKQTRAPAFRFKGVRDAAAFVEWVAKHFAEIKKQAEVSQDHLKLQAIRPIVLGNHVFLRFEADTGDAMGMNMITIASQQACEWISQQTGADFVTVTGNVCNDKKPCSLNHILGRGKTVAADVIVPEKVLKDVLKTTPEKFVQLVTSKVYLGGIASQSIGFNGHAANIFKAIFTATGQDEAHIVEGSLATTMAEQRGKDFYMCVHVPCIQVGTVGGGTRVETSRDCLRMMGCEGGGTPPGKNALKFAEIVAASVLAGELSALAALAEHQLTGAHAKMGR